MIQVIKYKCCDKIFAACQEPECYTDRDWTNELKKYVKEGCKVEMKPDGKSFNFEICRCNKTPKEQLTINL